nr:hypothetical protein [Bacillus licheniformis]
MDKTEEFELMNRRLEQLIKLKQSSKHLKKRNPPLSGFQLGLFLFKDDVQS